MGQLAGGDSALMPSMAGGAPAPGDPRFNQLLNKTQMNQQIPTQDSQLPNTLTPPPITDAPQPPSITQGAPQQMKGHKLLQILQSGIQGALAGRAASEQAVLQSGGPRRARLGGGV